MAKLIPKDPFKGFFKGSPGRLPRTPLLQSKLARFWFQLIQQTVRNGAYTYQQSSESKSMLSVQLNGDPFLNISSYDYLSLIGHPEIEAASIAAIQEFGTATGGVRMFSGTNVLHEQLEADLAAFKGTEAALTFSSGYTANLAVISSLVEKDALVLVDEKIHKSLVDACAMAQVPFTRFRHNDTDDLRAKLRELKRDQTCFIIIEGVYSMDGSIARLPEFVRVKDEFGCFLIVDEAHSFGVLGERGRGVHEYFDLEADRVDVWTCSLSKAIPANGGFVAGSQEMIIFLQHQASPYLFSSALNPGSVAAATEALKVIARSPERIARLWENTDYFLSQARRLGIDTGISESPIVPVIIGSRGETLRQSARLYQEQFLASAAVFPAVPFKEGRLRICMNAGYQRKDIDRILAAVLNKTLVHA